MARVAMAYFAAFCPLRHCRAGMWLRPIIIAIAATIIGNIKRQKRFQIINHQRPASAASRRDILIADNVGFCDGVGIWRVKAPHRRWRLMLANDVMYLPSARDA